MYCRIGTIKMQEDFKQEIMLQEVVSNKLLQGDPMNKKPKVVPLQKTFAKLFNKNK